MEYYKTDIRIQWTECLHGVASGCGVNCPTSFPAPSALGPTFNMTLIHTMATYISDEARALNNEGITGLDYWAPNIKYDQ
jgi:beta-glucosidase-like glycosyl hydrolase